MQTIHAEPLIRASARTGANVAIAYRVGDHVVSGTPLAFAWRVDGAAFDERDISDSAHESMRMGFERTLEQDAAFGIRQLVDIASKALSPAVNDPYTAVQAIDHVAVIMASIGRREHGTAVHTCSAGTTVTVPSFHFEDYLDLACAQIRRFGSKEPTVARELIALVSSTAHATAKPRRHAAIARQLDLILTDVERDVAQPHDLASVHADADALRALLADAPDRGSS